MKKNWNLNQPQNNTDLHPGSTSYSPAYTARGWAGVCPQALHWAVAGEEYPVLQPAAAARTDPAQKFSEGYSGGSKIWKISQQSSYMIFSGSALLLSLDIIISACCPKANFISAGSFLLTSLRRKISSLEGAGGPVSGFLALLAASLHHPQVQNHCSPDFQSQHLFS